MADQKPASRHGLTPAKGLLIAVLGTVLAVVLLMQFVGNDAAQANSSKPDRSAASRTRPGDAAENTGQPPPNSSTEPVLEIKPWPNMSLADALKCDPFQLPASLLSKPEGKQPSEDAAGQIQTARDERVAEEREQEMQQTLRTLRQTGVSFVVTGQGGKTAVIGSKRVRVGDVIDGFVVKDIRPDGVILIEAEH